MYQRKSKLPYLFLLPTLLILLMYSYAPVIYSVYLSFNNILPSGETVFVGLQNYKALFSNPYFYESLRNTVVYLVGSTLLIVVVGLIVALILNSKVRGASAYLTILFIPWVLSDVVVGSTWTWLLNPDFGVLKYIFAPLGLNPSSLISSTKYAMVGVIMVTMWKMLAYTTLLLLAGLQNISTDYVEAAKLDGCSGWGVIRRITLPIMMPTIITVTLLSIINCINQTGIILVLTNGGPIRATETLALFLYREAFLNYNFNAATTLSLVLAVINIIIVVFYIRLTNQKTVEE